MDTMKNSNLDVLVVDDDVDIRYAIANILRKCDCEVVEAASVESAFEALQSNEFSIVFSDMRFHGGLNGVDLLAHVKENYPSVDVVLISCAMDARQKTELLEKGAAYCLQKPFFKDTCLQVISDLGYNTKKVA